MRCSAPRFIREINVHFLFKETTKCGFISIARHELGCCTPCHQIRRSHPLGFQNNQQSIFLYAPRSRKLRAPMTLTKVVPRKETNAHQGRRARYLGRPRSRRENTFVWPPQHAFVLEPVGGVRGSDGAAATKLMSCGS